MIELLQNVIGKLTIFFSVLVSLAAVRILLRIKETPSSKEKFFIIGFSITYIAWTAYELLYISLQNQYPSYADIFAIIGDISLIVALIYLYLKNDKKELTFKDKELIIFTILITISIVFYLTYTLIIPGSLDVSLLEIILNFYYPIGGAIIFLLVFLNQIHNKEKRGFIFYIMVDMFLTYVANMIYVYTDYTETYGAIGLISDSFYLIGYLFTLLALLLFYKKITTSTETKDLTPKTS
jgi:hypothetical protein